MEILLSLFYCWSDEGQWPGKKILRLAVCLLIVHLFIHISILPPLKSFDLFWSSQYLQLHQSLGSGRMYANKKAPLFWRSKIYLWKSRLIKQGNKIVKSRMGVPDCRQNLNRENKLWPISTFPTLPCRQNLNRENKLWPITTFPTLPSSTYISHITNDSFSCLPDLSLSRLSR